MLRVFLIIVALAGFSALSGCVGPAEPKWASDADVARARYVHDGPPRITLYTVISNSSGSGAHTGLLINASERVLFDPAGTWYHPQLPERNDVHFGMSPAIVDFYVDYHTRITYHTVIQELDVSPQVAEMVMKRAEAYGAVPKAQCAYAVSGILRGVPGFESLPRTWFPKSLSRAFGELPGVKTRVVYDDDPDDHSILLVAPPALYVQKAAASGAGG